MQKCPSAACMKKPQTGKTDVIYWNQRSERNLQAFPYCLLLQSIKWFPMSP